MMSRLVSKLFGVSALIAVAAPAVAHADTMTVQNSIFTSTNDNNGTVSLTPFDTTRGTLTGVLFSFSGQTTVQIMNTGNIANGTYNAAVSADPNNAPVLTFLANEPLTVNGTGLAQSSAAAVSFSFTVPSSTVSLYTSASTDSVQLGPYFVLTDSNGNRQPDDGNDAYLAGTLTETFTYTPSAVAVGEPASALLLMAGVVGTSTLVRRRVR
jgi:hypothetical protein